MESWCRFWSQRKAGQEDNMFRITSGALNPVVSVEMETRIALIHVGSNSRNEVNICGDDVISLLQAMAYNEQKQVDFRDSSNTCFLSVCLLCLYDEM
jgi:hypothetical protein